VLLCRAQHLDDCRPCGHEDPAATHGHPIAISSWRISAGGVDIRAAIIGDEKTEAIPMSRHHAGNRVSFCRRRYSSLG
jgi:hypothetical protein